MQSKYFPDSSLWMANRNIPKSAFWASILKVMPLLKSHSFYQITQGNISIWTSPWCSVWERIYDHLIIQNSDFVYPAKVLDLWNSGHKSWNGQLISNLFSGACCYCYYFYSCCFLKLQGHRLLGPYTIR